VPVHLSPVPSNKGDYFLVKNKIETTVTLSVYPRRSINEGRFKINIYEQYTAFTLEPLGDEPVQIY